MGRLAPAVLLLAAASLLAAVATELEPNGLTTPAPQPLGALGPGGLAVEGVLDPTSPTGLDPGDRDGFSFTVPVATPFRAVLDDGGAGALLLALVEELPEGRVLRAAVFGPAPLALERPLLPAGSSWRIGVAAFGDGTPRPWSLALLPETEIPPWTGASCDAATAEAEPNPSAFDGTDLGWFDRTLCGSGSVEVASPIGSGIEGDVDWFRFRAVLDFPARLVFRGAPGVYDVAVEQVVFVGTAPRGEATFGQEAVIPIPVLEPGAEYGIRVSARAGTGPLAYSLHVEPVAAEPPPPAEPLELRRATLRLGDPARSSFAAEGWFQPGLGAGLDGGEAVEVRVRGGEAALAAGKTTLDALGRIVWRAPPGLPGIRWLRLDPFEGRLEVRGRGIDLDGEAGPEDPTVSLEVAAGGLRLGGAAAGTFLRHGRVLRVR